MTKETRALIKVAEKIISIQFLSSHPGWNKGINELRAAISSAKAAEEGVETTEDYFVEYEGPFGHWKHWAWAVMEGYQSHIIDEDDAKRRFKEIRQTPRRLMKRTRTKFTTVIEVREK